MAFPGSEVTFQVIHPEDFERVLLDHVQTAIAPQYEQVITQLNDQNKQLMAENEKLKKDTDVSLRDDVDKTHAYAEMLEESLQANMRAKFQRLADTVLHADDTRTTRIVKKCMVDHELQNLANKIACLKKQVCKSNVADLEERIRCFEQMSIPEFKKFRGRIPASLVDIPEKEKTRHASVHTRAAASQRKDKKNSKLDQMAGQIKRLTKDLETAAATIAEQETKNNALQLAVLNMQDEHTLIQQANDLSAKHVQDITAELQTTRDFQHGVLDEMQVIQDRKVFVEQLLHEFQTKNDALRTERDTANEALGDMQTAAMQCMEFSTRLREKEEELLQAQARLREKEEELLQAQARTEWTYGLIQRFAFLKMRFEKNRVKLAAKTSQIRAIQALICEPKSVHGEETNCPGMPLAHNPRACDAPAAPEQSMFGCPEVSHFPHFPRACDTPAVPEQIMFGCPEVSDFAHFPHFLSTEWAAEVEFKGKAKAKAKSHSLA